MMVLDGYWGLLEDASHLIISIGLFNKKIKITHGCTLTGPVLVHTLFPLRHSLQPRPLSPNRVHQLDPILHLVRLQGGVVEV